MREVAISAISSVLELEQPSKSVLLGWWTSLMRLRDGGKAGNRQPDLDVTGAKCGCTVTSEAGATRMRLVRSA